MVQSMVEEKGLDLTASHHGGFTTKWPTNATRHLLMLRMLILTRIGNGFIQSSSIIASVIINGKLDHNSYLPASSPRRGISGI